MKKGDIACIQRGAGCSVQGEVKHVHRNGEVTLVGKNRGKGLRGFPVGSRLAQVFVSNEGPVDYVFETQCALALAADRSEGAHN